MKVRDCDGASSRFVRRCNVGEVDDLKAESTLVELVGCAFWTQRAPGEELSTSTDSGLEITTVGLPISPISLQSQKYICHKLKYHRRGRNYLKRPPCILFKAAADTLVLL